MANSAFDLRLVSQHFRRAVQRTVSGEEDVNVSDYIQGYNELNKLFYQMGRLFSFIAQDIGDKTRILDEHRQSRVGNRYEFVGKMLAYERDETQLLQDDYRPGKNELPNGSRTLLRLHRALLFTGRLIDASRKTHEGEKIGPLVRKAYDDTLAPYHSWPVQKAVHFAVVTLPSRKKMLPMFAGNIPADQHEEAFQEAVNSIQAVYDIVQRQYEHYNLLNLP